MGQTCFSIILNYMKIYVHIPKSVNPHLFVIDVGDIGPCNLWLPIVYVCIVDLMFKQDPWTFPVVNCFINIKRKFCVSGGSYIISCKFCIHYSGLATELISSLSGTDLMKLWLLMVLTMNPMCINVLKLH